MMFLIMKLTWNKSVLLCNMPKFTGTRDFAACNHLRSYKYYSDSIINPTGFAGFACASYSDFTAVSSHRVTATSGDWYGSCVVILCVSDSVFPLYIS